MDSMSRMTDERLAEYVEAANRVPAERHGVMERLVYALKAERGWVAELEGERDRHKQNEQLQMERAIAAEAQLTALPKWAQSSESKGQFYRKYVQEMAALREQLAALREGLEGLVKRWQNHWRATADFVDYKPLDQIHCANELQSLLTQTTPTVNSAEHSIPVTEQQHQAMERALRKTAPEVKP